MAFAIIVETMESRVNPRIATRIRRGAACLSRRRWTKTPTPSEVVERGDRIVTVTMRSNAPIRAWHRKIVSGKVNKRQRAIRNNEFQSRSERLRYARLENLLLVTAILVAAAVGVHELTSGSKSGDPEGSSEQSEQARTLASSDQSAATESGTTAEFGLQLAQARAQLNQASEQLKASQDRVAQLEAQLKQAPALGDLDKARKQADDQRAQLSQASEQLKASQDRVVQLEAQLKQAPALGDLEKARKQADDQRAQLSQASEQLKASQDRVAQLEAQLKQAPALGAAAVASSSERMNATFKVADAISTPTRQPTNTTSAQPADPVPPSDPIQHSPLRAEILALLARGDSLMGAGDIASGRLFYERAAAAGNGEAALRLGETYDPAFLKRIQAGIQGDQAQAVYWYRRAFELGQSEAERLLNDAQPK